MSENARLSEEQEKIVKSLLWDCDLSPGDFYQVLKGKKEKAGFFYQGKGGQETPRIPELVQRFEGTIPTRDRQCLE